LTELAAKEDCEHADEGPMAAVEIQAVDYPRWPSVEGVVKKKVKI